MYFTTNSDRLGLNNIFPEEWQIQNNRFLLAFTISKIKTIQEIPTAHKILTYGDSIWLLIKASVEYPHAVKIISHEQPVIEGSLRMKTIDEDFYLVAFKKFDRRDYDRQKAIWEVEGNMLHPMNICGINSINSKIASNVIEFEKIDNSYRLHQVSTVINTTQAIWGADIRTEILRKIPEQYYNTTLLTEAQQNKFNLSQSWFYRSFTLSKLDAFVTKWIALETLCMDSSTNIRPISELLGLAYNIDFNVAKEKFKIGRLFGLRSNIVHNGHSPNITDEFLFFIDFLLVDCFNQKLDKPKLRKAELYLKSINLEIELYLNEIM